MSGQIDMRSVPRTSFKATAVRACQVVYLVFLSAFYIKALSLAAHGFASRLRMSRSGTARASISIWFALLLSLLWKLAVYAARGLRLLATKLLNAGFLILIRSARLGLRFAALVRGKIVR